MIITTQKHSLSKQLKFLDKLGKLGFSLFMLGIKLGLINRYGIFTLKFYDENGNLKRTAKCHNIITNDGIKYLGDILIGVNTTDITLAYIELDSGATTPALTDTDSQTPLTPADRLPVTSASRNTVAPFEITLNLFVTSGTFTRPQTINKINVFFGPDETGTMFSSGKLGTAAILGVGESVSIAYSFIFR